MASDAQVALVNRLVATVRALQPVLDEHVAFMDELLPHVFFGDLRRFVVGAFDGSAATARLDAIGVLAILEEAFSGGNPDIENIIIVSFLENLDPAAAGYAELRSLLGPNLQKELKEWETQ